MAKPLTINAYFALMALWFSLLVCDVPFTNSSSMDLHETGQAAHAFLLTLYE